MLPLNSFGRSHFWTQLPTLARLFAAFLVVVSLYAIISFSRILRRLRSLKRLPPSKSAPADLQNRLTNLRQLGVFTFFLFGLCFLQQLVWASIVFGDSNRFPFDIITEQLGYTIEYATDVLFIFLALHFIQWFVSVRVQVFARKHEFF